MRERAARVPPPPWYTGLHDVTTYDGANVIASSGLTVRSQYIASWHPGVALAVADWLERTVIDMEYGEVTGDDEALAVARAYLGTGTEGSETHA
jgi:hypothetical protein